MIRVAALALALAMGTTAAHADEVRVTGAGYIPGAVICPSGDLIDLAIDVIRQEIMVQSLPPVAQRNWEAMYGPAHGQLKFTGCALAPAGTRLWVVEQVGPLYHVSGSGYDGYATGMGLERVN